MPYTPDFEVTQDSSNVVVTIRVPHIRVSDAEISVDGSEFTFWCKPYLLNLRFPGLLQAEESERCVARYEPDRDDGTVVATLPKLSPGEHFDGLDLASALLRPSCLPAVGSLPPPPAVTLAGAHTGAARSTHNPGHGSALSPPSPLPGGAQAKRAAVVAEAARAAPPCIQVLSSTTFAEPTNDPEGGEDGGGMEGGAGGDGVLGNEEGGGGGGIGGGGLSLSGAMESLRLDAAPRYGFNRRYSGVFTRLGDQMCDVLDPRLAPEAGGAAEAARTALRTAAEDADFDEERYWGDEHYGWDEDPLLLAALHFKPHWTGHRTTNATSTGTGAAGAGAGAGAGGEGGSNGQGSGRERNAPPSSSSSAPPSTADAAAASSASVSPWAAFPTAAAAAAGRDEEVAAAAAASLLESPTDTPTGAGGSGGMGSEGNGGGGNGGGGDAGGGGGGVPSFAWTSEERRAMASLKRREYLLSWAEEDAALAATVSVLLGYTYDERFTCGEGSVESAWTLCKLSAALAWLQPFGCHDTAALGTGGGGGGGGGGTTGGTAKLLLAGPTKRAAAAGAKAAAGKGEKEGEGAAALRNVSKDDDDDDDDDDGGHWRAQQENPALGALVSGVRRVLCYPYFRSWTLATHVLCRDVLTIMRQGRRCVLRCLLAVRRRLERATSGDHQAFYLLNTVLLDDTLVWLQALPEARLEAFVSTHLAPATAALAGASQAPSSSSSSSAAATFEEGDAFAALGGGAPATVAAAAAASRQERAAGMLLLGSSLGARLVRVDDAQRALAAEEDEDDDDDEEEEEDDEDEDDSDDEERDEKHENGSEGDSDSGGCE